MRIEALKYLYDIRQAAVLLDVFLVGKTFADYQRDAMLRAAVEREFTIIGEAVSQLAKVDQELASRITNYRRQKNRGSARTEHATSSRQSERFD